MTDAILRSVRHRAAEVVVPFPSTSVGAMALLAGEAEGLAIDATTPGGTLAVKDATTVANNVSKSLASSSLVQASASTKNVIWNNGQLRTIAAGVVAQEYDANAGKFAVLVEPAATNLHLDSGDALAAFNDENCTSVASVNADPFGGAGAATVTASATNSLHDVFTASTQATTANTNYTVSAFVRNNGNQRYITLTGSGDGATQWYAATFDLVDGRVTQETNGAGGTIVSGSGKIVPLIGGNYFRLSVAGQHPDTNSYIFISFSSHDTPTHGNFGIEQYTPVGNETFDYYGPQIELGVAATSFILTTATSVTRVEDDITLDASTFPLSATAGSIYVDMKGLRSGSHGWGVQFDDTSNSERVAVYLWATDSSPYLTVTDNNAAQCDLDMGSWLVGNRMQLSGSWAANDFDASAEGQSVVSDVAGTLPTMTQLRLGRGATFAATLGPVYIYRMVYVPRNVQAGSGNLPSWRFNF